MISVILHLNSKNIVPASGGHHYFFPILQSTLIIVKTLMKRKLGQIKVRSHINSDRCPFTEDDYVVPLPRKGTLLNDPFQLWSGQVITPTAWGRIVPKYSSPPPPLPLLLIKWASIEARGCRDGQKCVCLTKTAHSFFPSFWVTDRTSERKREKREAKEESNWSSADRNLHISFIFSPAFHIHSFPPLFRRACSPPSHGLCPVCVSGF